jgi:serine/threonine protein kinase
VHPSNLPGTPHTLDLPPPPSLQKYRYERLQELGSGSYAVVYKARNRETDEVIALKKLRFGFDEQGLPSSTLREISLLKDLKHANIVE